MPTVAMHEKVIPSPGLSAEDGAGLRAKGRRRVLAFSTVFLVALAAGLVYVFSRAPVYQATASLLISAAPHVDENLETTDPQHIAIERQRLLGQVLLDQTLTRLYEQGTPLGLGSDELRRMLEVAPVPDTYMVELRAQGSDPHQLAEVVNVWVQVYLEARAKEASVATGETTAALREEYDALTEKADQQRAAMDAFRQESDILTTERSENEILARLKGLTDSLNAAKEAEVKAEARLEALNKALARGEPVVPEQDKRSMAELERRAQELRERLAELNRRYTPEYIRLEPSLRVVAEQLQDLEQRIQTKRDFGERYLLSEARQELESAQQTRRAVERQLQDHRRLATEFTARFTKHEALQEDLARLEELQRMTQERLVRLEVQNRERYPPVTVLEQAYPPARPVWPNYGRDAAIALGAAVGLAVLAVWLLDFLSRREPPQGGVSVAGINLYSREPLLISGGRAPEGLDRGQPPAVLGPPTPRELDEDEVAALWAAADIGGRQLLALLLIGLSLEESAALNAAHFDLANGTLRAPGAEGRAVRLPPAVVSLFEGSGDLPAWFVDNGEPIPIEEFRATLKLLAVDAGLVSPTDVDDQSLRHTYIAYLVRQGLRLSDVPRVVGRMRPTELERYGHLSPTGPGKTLEQISSIYPVLARPVKDV